MAEAKEKHEPIRQSVHVDCPIEDAFRLFTERFGEWFPEGRDPGHVTLWEPPRRVEFEWSAGSTVEVEFRVVADGTQVTLIHRGWESTGVEMNALRHFSAYACTQAFAIA